LTWLGSLRLVAVLGGIQVLLGLAWWWRAAAVRARTAAPVVGGLGLMGWLALHPVLVLPAPIYQEDSPYQQIRVRDDDLLRYLILDRTFHAIMWRVEPVELFLPYSQMMMAALALHPAPKRALILGHGGGSLAKWLARRWPDLELDLVEVDPSVVRAAEQYFGYSGATGHRMYVNDARAFFRTTDARYDVIWLDVFARHLIPFHLTTQEFFAEVRSHLNPDGVLAVNLSSSGDGPARQRANAVVATLRTVFPLIESFGVKGPWQTPQPDAENLIFFAGAPVTMIRQPEFTARVAELVAQRRMPSEVPGLLATRRDRDWPQGVILTDDYAPFDLLMGGGMTDDGPPAMAPLQSR